MDTLTRTLTRAHYERQARIASEASVERSFDNFDFDDFGRYNDLRLSCFRELADDITAAMRDPERKIQVVASDDDRNATAAQSIGLTIGMLPDRDSDAIMGRLLQIMSIAADGGQCREMASTLRTQLVTLYADSNGRDVRLAEIREEDERINAMADYAADQWVD